MKPRTLQSVIALLALTASLNAALPKDTHKTWTDPEVAFQENPDFGIQGEYSNAPGGAAVGVQVVARGDGKFEAYVFAGGLPGFGARPGTKSGAVPGQREGDQVVFANATNKISATIVAGQLTLTAADGTKSTLPRIERRSPTLGAKPPAGAVVLFDGSSAAAWEGGKMENGFLLATSCTTKAQFADYKLHLEFRTPYKPTARGQQRGNSGVYHSGRWETQILDSFGLEGRDNDCGGIYSISKPRLNMCLPPLAWQTYDVDFTAAKFDAAGQRTAWPRITVKLNGVLVHENLELAKNFTTSAPLTNALTGPQGPIHLQSHGNPVVFRNIWVAPGK